VQRADGLRREVQPAVALQLQAEIVAGVKTPEYYATLAPAAEGIKHQLLRFLLQAKADGKRVVGYGAAAKGNTLLNYAGVKPDLLAWVADANPHKQGKFLPGSRIPVVSPERIALEQPDYILVLPWNLLTEITQQFASVKEWGAQFVVAVPELSIQ
jgi:ABC-type Fe3+-hydroxamate transport system substrate-binding protein